MKSPKEIYESFRQSMLLKSDDWTEMLSEGVELIGPLAQITGKAGFIEVNKPFFSSIVSSELHELIASESKIITRISTTVNVPSGKTIVLEVSEWYEIVNEELRSLRVYFDTSELKKELGIE